MAEMRIDAVDGKAYTYAEYLKFYKKDYKKKAIAKAWEGLAPAKPKSWQKVAAKAEPKGEPKAKAVAALMEQQRYYIAKGHQELRAQSHLLARGNAGSIAEHRLLIWHGHKALRALSGLVSDNERMLRT